MRRKKKYELTRLPCSVLLFFLLLVSAQVKAQDDSATMVVDTIPPQVETTTIETQAVTEENTPSKYFLEKKQYPDSITIESRQLPDSVVKKMQADDAFWYANADLKKKVENLQVNNYVPLTERSWFKTLLWLLIIGGFAGFIMWYLAGSNVGLFRKKQIRTGENLLEDEMTEDIFSINYQKEIEKAAQQGNYRLAVRLMFLRLLKNLSDKNIIAYKQDRTNFDYLMQLQPTQFYHDFFRVTRNYEYSWYGHFEISGDTYAAISKDFDNLQNQIN